MSATTWTTTEPNVAAVLAEHRSPLSALAEMRTAAIVLRGVLSPAACRAVIRRFIDRELMYDPAVAAVPERFVKASVREGGFGRIADPTYSMFAGQNPESRRRRIDIGTSLGNLGNHPDEFFADARKTHELFATLFDGLANPIDVLYSSLGQLAAAEGKQVKTAHEPDGRLYGPAIFRIHYGGYTYGPHFDSVRLREKREGYAVHRFEHQFAGVLCLQNTELAGQTAQCILHRCLWTPEVNAVMENGFHEHAAATGIPNVRVDLAPGDLYFFNTRLIHEVPGVAGDQPRAVLATFIGYSPDDSEVFVWS
jgi:hypothetical protein